MKGLELSRKFYKEVGEPMLKLQFSEVLPFLAAGLIGSGSECFGFDDEVSRDHDFEPAFCIFIPDEDVIDRKAAFSLERAYAKLPKEFMGFKRQSVAAVGGARHGVIRISDFFISKTGSPDGNLSVSDWFSVPEYSLAEAVNGEIFMDNYGKISEIRKNLSHYPEDIRLKKEAGNLLLMAQSGQYNYPRSISRGDEGAAQLAAIEFAKSAVNLIFLINKKYSPYYKWSFRALKELPILNELSEPILYLISSGNCPENAAKKTEIIENIARAVAKELSSPDNANLEELAYSVNQKIKDSSIRNKHILAGI